MPFTIHASPCPGDDIGPTSIEAQRLANFLGADIRFDFNGVTCNPIPGGSAAKLHLRQQSEQGGNRNPKIATSHRHDTIADRG